MLANLPDWLQLFLAAAVGAATAVLGAGKFGWFSRDRTAIIEAAIQRLEAKIDIEIAMIKSMIVPAIEKDRHDNIWPRIQTEIFKPLDRAEDRLGKLEQDMAVVKHHLAIVDLPAFTTKSRQRQQSDPQ